MARRKHKRPHGTGSISQRDQGWQVQWTEPDGTRRSKTFKDEEAGRQYLKEACAGLVAPRDRPGDLNLLAQTWLDGRAAMASNYDDRNRWKNHLGPIFGALKPNEVGVPDLKAAVVALRAKGLGRSTVGLCLKLLSSLYGDLVEDGVARVNPVKLLSRKTRVELRSDWDPKKVPFLREPSDVVRVYRRLREHNESVALAYIICALAGLRPGEVRALAWDHVDLDRRLIHVQAQVARRGGGISTPKDDDSRLVPVTDALYVVLSAYHPRVGLVCQPSSGSFLGAHLMGRLLAQALAELEIKPMRWYEATRHTFASQWVLNGGSLETLREMMGHSSVVTTERYAHLVPGNYTDADRARVPVEVTAPARAPLPN